MNSGPGRAVGVPRAWRLLLPRAAGAEAPTWTISRVLFRSDVAAQEEKIIPLGAALPRRSSTLTRVLRPACAGRLGGPPSTVPLFELAPGRACLAAGHPAVARGLLPHDFTLTVEGGPSLRRCDFCCAFPRVTPGRC